MRHCSGAPVTVLVEQSIEVHHAGAVVTKQRDKRLGHRVCRHRREDASLLAGHEQRHGADAPSGLFFFSEYFAQKTIKKGRDNNLPLSLNEDGAHMTLCRVRKKA